MIVKVQFYKVLFDFKILSCKNRYIQNTKEYFESKTNIINLNFIYVENSIIYKIKMENQLFSVQIVAYSINSPY